jgi:hypothetical protein
MRAYKQYMVLMVPLLILSGCAQLAAISDYVNENPLVADIATRQAVARYVEAGDDTSTRAAGVVRVVGNLELFLDGNPQATVEALITVINSSINWDNLSISDRLLAEDLIAILVIKLDQVVSDGEMDAGELLGIRSLLVTARRAAELYQ